jgi:Flp pilus assembly pilin Flp
MRLDGARRFFGRKRRGASLLTYGLAVGLIAVAAIGSVSLMGGQVSGLFGDVGLRLGGVTDGLPDTPETPETPSSPASLALSVFSGDEGAMDVTGPGSPAYGGNVVVRISNSGDLASASLSASLGSGANVEITADDCSGNTVAGGGHCDITLRPFAGASGAISDSLSVAGVSGSPLALSGTASNFTPASLSLSVVSGDEGAMDVTGPGSPAYGGNVVVRVGNSGELTSSSLSVSLGSGANVEIIADECSGDTLAGGADCDVTMRPFADANGAIGDSLVIAGVSGSPLALSGTASGFPIPFSATGGTIVDSGGYRIHSFTSSGSFQVLSGSRSDIEYLIVASGGSGGTNGRGGGGGGGCVPGSGQSVSAGNYPVVVGPAQTTFESNGSDSSVFGLTAVGGGAGTAGTGGNGGSGGGGFTAGGSGTVGQGYAGGAHSGASYDAGGGGGAGGPGATGVGGVGGGNGGDGISSGISGTATYYCGGGGGGRWSGSQDGTNGLGGGMSSYGGGGRSGGTWVNDGGPGIVIIRYPL